MLVSCLVKMSFQPLTPNSKNIQVNSHCHPFYHLSALVHGENDHNIVNNFHCVFLKYVYSFGKQNPPRYVFERHNCNNSMWVKNLPYFNQWSANLRCIYVFPDCKYVYIIYTVIQSKYSCQTISVRWVWIQSDAVITWPNIKCQWI